MAQHDRHNHVNRGQIQRGLQKHKDDKNRIDDQGVKIFRVSGRVQIIGTGECSVDVDFPVTFAELPAVSFGWELAKLQTSKLLGGYLPSANVGIASWKTVPKVAGLFHYTGCVLIVTAVNNPHYMWIHWHAEGRAFQNPVQNLDSADPLTE